MNLAIQYLHSHGVCHRDLKLENILINTTTQKIKIIDFGLALNTPLDGSSQRPPYLTKHRCGSEEYASPELILGGPYDARYVDIWACGVIFFALLVGYLPFSPPTPPSSPSRKQKQKNNLDSVSSRKKRTQMYHRICRGEYTLPPELSTESENLLKVFLFLS